LNIIFNGKAHHTAGRRSSDRLFDFRRIISCILREILLNCLYGGVSVPKIKPISDLRNYGEVLRDVAVGSPVFLTKNGHGRYAVLDIDEYVDYEKMLAWRRLAAELEEGRRSGETEGWIPSDEVRAHFEERYNGKN